MNDSAREQAMNLVRQRRDELLEQRRRLRHDRERLEARDREIDRELADCVAGARIFGHTLELPEEDRQEGHFSATQAILARRRARHAQWVARRRREEAEEEQTMPAPSMPKIKDIVIDRLKAAAEEGTKAAPIQKYITETYSRKIHDKTVGMTLYRLKLEGLAHKRGIVWFFGPGLAGTKNPGVAAPGPFNLESE